MNIHQCSVLQSHKNLQSVWQVICLAVLFLGLATLRHTTSLGHDIVGWGPIRLKQISEICTFDTTLEFQYVNFQFVGLDIRVRASRNKQEVDNLYNVMWHELVTPCICSWWQKGLNYIVTFPTALSLNVILVSLHHEKYMHRTLMITLHYVHFTMLFFILVCTVG